ncbi:SRPBCC family protein [Fischerella sp. PCC 9605]|jgi:uncharacterized protein YndB with AHSA1/START domain|uniref:SRPBCC family protein n=1 Tax=Fischerella sp. PCC 9605 TaxID=1173024 RepID=UPI00047D7D60|nr:SRPBCC domain-containing protein [Fischerella sp. PCC 9605]
MAASQHKLHFSIDINAPRERVWKVLWEDATFRDWASVFTEGSYIESDWKEDGRFEFFDSSGSGGSYGIIEKLVPNEFISFKHLGEIREGKEYPFDDGDRLENYTLKEKDGITTLTLDHDIPKEYKSMFEDVTPKAFERIKELAEK